MGGSLLPQFRLYVGRQASSPGRYLLEQLVLGTFGWMPTVLGIGVRSLAYRLILTMPDDMSVERQRLLARYGAEIQLTPAIEGMTGAVFAAQELVREHPEYFMPQQFQNPANPEIYRRTTALEILEAMEGRRIDAFVAGVGTGRGVRADDVRQQLGASPGRHQPEPDLGQGQHRHG